MNLSNNFILVDVLVHSFSESFYEELKMKEFLINLNNISFISPCNYGNNSNMYQIYFANAGSFETLVIDKENYEKIIAALSNK